MASGKTSQTLKVGEVYETETTDGAVGLKVMIDDIVLNINSKKKVQIKVESSKGEHEHPGNEKQGAGLTVTLDKDTMLNINDNKLDIDSNKGVQMSVQTRPKETTAKEKPGGDRGGGQTGGSDQSEKGTGTMLKNTITKLQNYKGVVITALIAVSLGFFLRRKFKGSVPH